MLRWPSSHYEGVQSVSKPSWHELLQQGTTKLSRWWLLGLAHGLNSSPKKFPSGNPIINTGSPLVLEGSQPPNTRASTGIQQSAYPIRKHKKPHNLSEAYQQHSPWAHKAPGFEIKQKIPCTLDKCSTLGPLPHPKDSTPSAAESRPSEDLSHQPLGGTTLYSKSPQHQA